MRYRTFKLSRIDRLNRDETTFKPRIYLLEPELDTAYQPQLVAIKALISPAVKDQFIERYGGKSIENYNSEYLLATIDIPHNSAGFQFLASFCTNLEVVEPKSHSICFLPKKQPDQA